MIVGVNVLSIDGNYIYRYVLSLVLFICFFTDPIYFFIKEGSSL